MSKKPATKRKPAVQRQSPVELAKTERRNLNARIRLEREIVRLADALERTIRKADRRLVELGGALMQRDARMNRAEAGLDLAREDAIRDRQPVAAD